LRGGEAPVLYPGLLPCFLDSTVGPEGRIWAVCRGRGGLMELMGSSGRTRSDGPMVRPVPRSPVFGCGASGCTLAFIDGDGIATASSWDHTVLRPSPPRRIAAGGTILDLVRGGDRAYLIWLPATAASSSVQRVNLESGSIETVLERPALAITAGAGLWMLGEHLSNRISISEWHDAAAERPVPEVTLTEALTAFVHDAAMERTSRAIVVVWRDWTEQQLMAWILSADGRAVGAPFALTSTPGPYRQPVLAAVDDTAWVAWTEESSSGGVTGIRVATIDLGTGMARGAPSWLAPSAGSQPRLAATSRGALLSWLGPEGQLRVTRLGRGGEALDPAGSDAATVSLGVTWHALESGGSGGAVSAYLEGSSLAFRVVAAPESPW